MECANLYVKIKCILSDHIMLIYKFLILFLGSAWIHLHDLKFKTYSVHWCSTFCLKHSALVPVSLKPEFLKCLHGLVSTPSLLWLVSHLVSQKYNTQFHNCVLAPEAYCKQYYIYGNYGVVVGRWTNIEPHVGICIYYTLMISL